MTVPGVGPRPARIMIVGEAPGADEERDGLPFVGASGRLLNQMLARVGLDRTECFITNVIQTRPPANDIEKFCVSRKELPPNYLYPPVKKGKFLSPEFLPELPRLSREIREVNPNVIIAFGNLACWALISNTGIDTLRGAVAPCTLVAGKKVLPSYHPAYVLRDWPVNNTVCLDLLKAKRESEFPEIRRPKRTVAIDPSLADIRLLISKTFKNATHLAVDIETKKDLITCVGFSASPEFALVIPFEDTRQLDGNYWRSYEEEIEAWRLVEELLMLPAVKIFQNGLYDMQFFFKMGLRIRNCCADTMLLHHSLYPEMPKGLGFLGSIYTDESAWKLMHSRSRDEKVKAAE